MLDHIYQRRKKNISLTPLIDVVFILLMFFMLTSSFIKEKQFELRSPATNAAATDSKVQRVWLTDNGELIGADAEAITAYALGQFDTQKSLTVHPENQTTLQATVTALEFLKSKGFQSVNLSRAYTASAPSLDVVSTQAKGNSDLGIARSKRDE